MAESSTQLLIRISTLLEQLIAATRDGAKKLESLALIENEIGKCTDRLEDLAKRLESIVKDTIENQAEIRSIMTSLRVDVRHDTADIVQKIKLQEPSDSKSDEPALSLKGGSISLGRVLVVTGSAICAASGWVWTYREQIAKFLLGQ